MRQMQIELAERAVDEREGTDLTVIRGSAR